ncbi:MAG TPA: methyltransferase domain-containing protein [Candidatus Limnocylindria bacterium]|nr:methyltransferase domain-containing protein [Candidatus Limnocylindria bacterium]
MAVQERAQDPLAQAHDDDVGQFDRWSTRYETSRWQGLHFDRVHGRAFALASRFGRPDAILDVGCGTGRLLRAAHARWPSASLFGVDPSEGMIHTGRRITPAELHLSGAEAIPLPDSSVDMAFSTIAFHHWADQERGLREVARVLRPGGGFVLIDNIGPDWVARNLRDRPYLTAQERVALWTDSGLRVLEQRRIILLPFAIPVLLATVAERPAGGA